MFKFATLLSLLLVAGAMAKSADVLPSNEDKVNSLCPGVEGENDPARVCLAIKGNIRELIKNPKQVSGYSSEEGDGKSFPVFSI